MLTALSVINQLILNWQWSETLYQGWNFDPPDIPTVIVDAHDIPSNGLTFTTLLSLLENLTTQYDLLAFKSTPDFYQLILCLIASSHSVLSPPLSSYLNVTLGLFGNLGFFVGCERSVKCFPLSKCLNPGINRDFSASFDPCSYLKQQQKFLANKTGICSGIYSKVSKIFSAGRMKLD